VCGVGQGCTGSPQAVKPVHLVGRQSRGNTALSLGERVASGASQVRGCFVRGAPYALLWRPSDPSLVPLRLEKAPSRDTLSPEERAVGSLQHLASG